MLRMGICISSKGVVCVSSSYGNLFEKRSDWCKKRTVNRRMWLFTLTTKLCELAWVSGIEQVFYFSMEILIWFWKVEGSRLWMRKWTQRILPCVIE